VARAVGIDLGTTNSVIAVLVGQQAKNQAVANPHRTVASVKRHMGTTWSVTIDGHTYTPQEISARILLKLKRDAEAYLGEQVADAIITVPSCFGDEQRQATREAGQIAGLNVLRLINEPTAAAVAYGLDKGDREHTVLVFDLGGGTFDVSLLEIGNGVVEVRATVGNPMLAGIDWDHAVAAHLSSAAGEDFGPIARQRLLEAAERAKIDLSSLSSTTIHVPYLGVRDGEVVHLVETLSRAKFELMTRHLLEQCRGPLEQALRDACVGVVEIDHVVLVGGSTRMPAVAGLVREFMNGKEPHRGVNPDEVVAVGAALQAGVLKGEVKDVLLLDVFPFSLGIGTKGGVFTKLIGRNTTIPTKRSEVFRPAGGIELGTGEPDNAEKQQGSKSYPRQPTVRIEVYQGERELVRDNKILGSMELTGLLTGAEIEVTFDIDANGDLQVSAQELATGNAVDMRMTGRTALPRNALDEMVTHAEREVEEQRRRRETQEIRNQLEETVNRFEATLHTVQVPSAVHAAVDRARRALRDYIDDRRLDEALAEMRRIAHGDFAFTEETPEPEPEPEPVVQPEPRPDSGDFSWDFFVSYTQKDEEWANWIAWQLDHAGYQVLIQAWHMVPGTNWMVMMQEGIRRSARTLAVVSPAYLKSVYGQTEWMGAYQADPQGFERKLVPVRVEECERPGILGHIVSFDLFGLVRQTARAQLLKYIKAALAGHDKPGVEPTFPTSTVDPATETRTPAPQAPPDDEPRFPA
jgi:molecular chaperone DnaK